MTNNLLPLFKVFHQMWRDAIHISQEKEKEKERKSKKDCIGKARKNVFIGNYKFREKQEKEKPNFKILSALRKMYWKTGHNFQINA